MPFHPMLLIFAFTGVIVTFIGISLKRKAARFLATALKATGEVIAAKEMRSGPTSAVGRQSLSAVARFSLPDGRSETVVSRIGSLTPAKIGTRVTVLYDPTNPKEALLDNWMEIHGPWLIFFLVGLIQLSAVVLAVLFGD